MGPILLRSLFYASLLSYFLTHARIVTTDLRKIIRKEAEALNAITAVLYSPSDNVSIFSIGDNDTVYVPALRGVAVFQVKAEQANVTESFCTRVADKIKLLRQTAKNVVIVVTSNDPVFLITLLYYLLKEGVLEWSVRLLVVTRLPMIQLQQLNGFLSQTNSILLYIDDRGFQIRFTNKPTLRVTLEQYSLLRVITLEEKTSVGEHRIWADGYMVTVLEYVAQGLNFSYTFTRPRDGTWGTKKGAFVTGMLGQVYREEADLGLGPFGMHASRAEVVDFTWPLTMEYASVLAGLGSPGVHPWAFLFPLSTEVWAASLLCFFIVTFVQTVLSAVFDGVKMKCTGKLLDFFAVALHETVPVERDVCWWWQRVMLGTWILGTMVLTKSYEGNLMSLLAVKDIRQPFKTMSDVLDDKSVSIIWQSNGIFWQYVMDGQADLFSNIREAEERGRVHFLELGELSSAMDAETRRGRKVIVGPNAPILGLISQDFTNTGTCGFYVLREDFLPTPLSLITKKNSPLLHGLNIRIISMNEAGLFDLWYRRAIPNITFCKSSPKKIHTSFAFSLHSFSALFILLGAGHTFCLIAFCIEILKMKSRPEP